MALVAAATSPALAVDVDVFLANDSDVDINDVAVSAAGQSSWLDVDQGSVLQPNSMFTLTVGDEDGCRFDFRADYADGFTETVTDVEVCQASEAGEVWVHFGEFR